jgi:hypothetical protein
MNPFEKKLFTVLNAVKKINNQPEHTRPAARAG